ncbi:MAG TPA: GNAT family N-acetyltransferase [Candidatus Limnocylindrales bacterium]|nr:GNAT family N-acetyltransferase [Candidatus Limnocylindrales bacterium]
MSSPRVIDVPERSRFELMVGDRAVGFTEYHLAGDLITLSHTEIDPDVEGQGYGSRLAAGVLEATRERGLGVIVICPFITAYLQRHRAEYPDIDLHAGKPRIGRSG